MSIKAIVIEDGRLLALRCGEGRDAWYELPGGGQIAGETVPEALRRECLEETGLTVVVGRLRFVRDYIADHHEFAGTDAGVAQLELMFECRVVHPESGAEAPARRPTDALPMGHVPDKGQTGVEWLVLEDGASPRFFPRALWGRLVRAAAGDEPVYLGDVN